MNGSDASPLASVVVPTRDRPDYLEITLQSLRDQQLQRPLYEIVIVDDASRAGVVERVVKSSLGSSVDWKTVRLNRHSALNAARNAGIEASTGDLVVFVDDDVKAPKDWLDSYVKAAQRYPDIEAFSGPIRAKFEGLKLSFCGRDKPPITTQDFGQEDVEIDRAWGANMAIRRSAFDRIGLFDANYKSYGGDEEEWEERLLKMNGKIMYIADASLWHRRSRNDSTLKALAGAAFRQGRGLREYDRMRGDTKPLTRELKIFAGCLGHSVRYRCTNGLIMAAHSAGRITDATVNR